MDNQVDGKRFRELMDQLHAAFKEGFKANDALSDAYWKALRDVPFTEVKANVERFIATATRDTPFPRPAMLRNAPPKILSSGLPTPAQLKAERDSVRRWRELKKTDPIAFEVEWRAARAFTAMAQCEDGSDEYADWLQQYRRWGDLRYASRTEQEEACRNFLGMDIPGVDPP